MDDIWTRRVAVLLRFYLRRREIRRIEINCGKQLLGGTAKPRPKTLKRACQSPLGLSCAAWSLSGIDKEIVVAYSSINNSSYLIPEPRVRILRRRWI